MHNELIHHGNSQVEHVLINAGGALSLHGTSLQCCPVKMTWRADGARRAASTIVRS
jgi:hypothetical protein